MNDKSLPSIARVTRQDRAKDDGWIRAFLLQAPFGTLATTWHGQPFLRPLLFVYDEEGNTIYFHGALEGRARTNIIADARVCFCAAEMGRLLPAKTAMEFGVEYASVVVFGKAAIITDEIEARHGLQLLLDKYFPRYEAGVDYHPIVPEEMAITTVYRLDIDEWSGKEERAALEYPGAFFYADRHGG